MQIKKSELRKVIQERLQMFFSDTKPFATVGRAPSMKSGIEDLNSEDVEVDQDALDAAIAETVKDLEKGASLRMQAEAKGVTNSRDAMLKKAIGKMITEISGVDSLKPNDPHTPEDEAEKDAADDVMEADPKEKKGRPRGAPHIENVRFWDLPERSLRYIIKDAGEAIAANPLSRKATGKWADEINDAVAVLHFRKKKGIKVERIEEAWKLGGLGPKILNDPSTIKMVNPKNPGEIFVIFSRQKKGGGKQDKISMAVVDKTGRALKDWGSHVNEKGALKFAQTRGFTKKVNESFNAAPYAQGKEQASVIGANESPEMGSLAASPKSKALIKKMHELVTKKLKFKTVEDIQPIQGGVAFIFGDKAEASKMEKYLKNAGALGKVIPLRAGGGKRTMVSLRAK